MATSKLTLPVALLILLGGWVISLYLPFNSRFPVAETAFLKLLSGYLPNERTITLGINLVLYLLIGFLLIPFNNAVVIIRTRASIHTSLFFIWSALLPVLHPLHPDILMTFILMLSLVCLIAGYQHPHPMAYVYHAWLLLGFASFLVPEVLFLIPVYILGAYQFQILSFKSLVAGLLGLAFAYLVFCFLAWALGGWDLVVSQQVVLEKLCTEFHFPVHEDWLNVLAAYHGILWLVALFYYGFKKVQINIRTRDFIHFMLWTEVLLQGILYLKPGTLCALLPVSLICLCLIEGHLFTTVKTKLSNFFFILILVTSVVVYGLTLWRI